MANVCELLAQNRDLEEILGPVRAAWTSDDCRKALQRIDSVVLHCYKNTQYENKLGIGIYGIESIARDLGMLAKLLNYPVSKIIKGGFLERRRKIKHVFHH